MKRSKSPEKQINKSPEKKQNSNSSSRNSYDKGYEKTYDRSFSDKSYDKRQNYNKSPEKHLPAITRSNKAKVWNSSIANRLNISESNGKLFSKIIWHPNV